MKLRAELASDEFEPTSWEVYAFSEIYAAEGSDSQDVADKWFVSMSDDYDHDLVGTKPKPGMAVMVRGFDEGNHMSDWVEVKVGGFLST